MALQEELKTQGDFLFRHRSHLPVLLLLATIWVKFYQERFNGPASESLAAEILEGSALAVGMLGLAIRVATVGFAPDNTSGRNTGAGQIADVLNTTGAYSLTRNPLYLGNYFMWVAVAMTTGSASFVFAFSLVFWIYYERIILAEESFLRSKFGAGYLDWAATTPVFLPGFSRYTAPNAAFRWRKVLKQEKNGLFALFLLLCLLGLVGDLGEGQLSLREERLSIAGAALAGTAYLFLKILKEQTSFLCDKTGDVPGQARVLPHTLTAKLFHWGFIVVFAFGLIRQVDEVEELENSRFLAEEIVFATFFLTLLLARFIYMRTTRPAPTPGSTSGFLPQVARFVHLGLYANLAGLALSGILIGGLHASAASDGTVFKTLLWLHEACFWSSVALTGLHVIGAVYHRLRGDGIWSSMVPVFVEKPDRPTPADSR